MEIKKIIGKVLAAVAIGFALMVLYTNAFPMKIKTGTEWVEYESNEYYCGNNGVVRTDNYAALPQERKAAIRETFKKWAAEHPNQYKFDEETDTFYCAKEHYIYWKGFEIFYN